MEKWREFYTHPKIWVFSPPPKKKRMKVLGVPCWQEAYPKIPFPPQQSAKMWRFTGSLRRKALRWPRLQELWPFGAGRCWPWLPSPKTKRTNFSAPKKGAFPKENDRIPTSNHPFSGGILLSVSGRVAKKMLVHRRVHIPYSNFEESTY